MEELAVKLAPESEDLVEGLSMPYGGPFGGKDLAGEFFSAKTDFALDWFQPGERPLLYHHGLDAEASTAVVGRVKDYKATDTGVWAQAQLDKSSEYFDAIKELVKQGKLFFSSGSMNHLVEKTKRGELTRWPFIELSLTPTPCNLLAATDLVETTKHFEQAGIKSAAGLETLKAELSSASRNDMSKSGFAYVDSKGATHLPINDAAHVKNAMARFGQTQFETPAKKKTAAKKIIAKAKSLGIDVSTDSAVSQAAKALPVFATRLLKPIKALPSATTLVDGDDSYGGPEGSYEDLIGDLTKAARATFGSSDPYDYGSWVHVVSTFPGYCVVCVNDDGDTDYYEVAYEIGDDQEPTLGEMRQVQRVYQPMAMPETEEAPLAIQAARLSDFAKLVTNRSEGVNERRVKEGRIISQSNRTRLKETSVALEGALKALQDLLDATEPQPAKAASLDTSAQTRELELLEIWASVELAQSA